MERPEHLPQALRFLRGRFVHPDPAGEALAREAQRALARERHVVAAPRERREIEAEDAVLDPAGAAQRETLEADLLVPVRDDDRGVEKVEAVDADAVLGELGDAP